MKFKKGITCRKSEKLSLTIFSEFISRSFATGFVVVQKENLFQTNIADVFDSGQFEMVALPPTKERCQHEVES